MAPGAQPDQWHCRRTLVSLLPRPVLPSEPCTASPLPWREPYASCLQSLPPSLLNAHLFNCLLPIGFQMCSMFLWFPVPCSAIAPFQPHISEELPVLDAVLIFSLATHSTTQSPLALWRSLLVSKVTDDLRGLIPMDFVSLILLDFSLVGFLVDNCFLLKKLFLSSSSSSSLWHYIL